MREKFYCAWPSWDDEWQLLVFNIKQLWKNRYHWPLAPRITRETYMLCVVFASVLPQSVLSFVSILEIVGICSIDSALPIMLGIEVLNVLILLWAMGSRLQDIGVHRIVVWIMLIICMWKSGFLANPEFYFPEDPVVRLYGKGGHFLALKVPAFVFWIKFISMFGIFLPQNENPNVFGEVPKRGITLFEKNYPEWRLPFFSRSFQYIDERNREETFHIPLLKTLRYALNFRGRTPIYDFGMAELFLVFCQAGFLPILINTGFQGNWGFSDIVIITHCIFFIPTMSLYARRLHDGYNSALWIPLAYIPLIGLYFMWMLLVEPSWKWEEN